MAHALKYLETAKPERAGVRAKRRLYGRQRIVAQAKRMALFARMKAKVAEANDPSTWTSLAGLSDQELKAALFRP